MTLRYFTRAAAAALAFAASFALPSAAGAQPAPQFSTVRVSTGIRLNYAEQGGGAAEPIVLLHGLSDSWFSFSRVLPLLSAQRRVYALDLRGHGGSDKPKVGYGMSDLAADVIAFMDAKGIERATILGHSMGSFVAQQVALSAPRRVSRLILVGSATSPRKLAGMTELESVVRSLKDPVPADFLREFQLSTVHDNVPKEFIDRAVEESGKLPARAWHGLLDGLLLAEAPAALGTSGIPTLVMWGDKDTYALGPEQNALVELIRTASLKTYVDTGHAPHWERPAAFARDVLAFIARPVAND